MSSFAAGVADAFTKHAAFGRQAVEGQTKTIAGVTKTFRGGRWVAPSAPSTLSSVAGKLKGMFTPKPSGNPLLRGMARKAVAARGTNYLKAAL